MTQGRLTPFFSAVARHLSKSALAAMTVRLAGVFVATHIRGWRAAAVVVLHPEIRGGVFVAAMFGSPVQRLNSVHKIFCTIHRFSMINRLTPEDTEAHRSSQRRQGKYRAKVCTGACREHVLSSGTVPDPVPERGRSGYLVRSIGTIPLERSWHPARHHRPHSSVLPFFRFSVGGHPPSVGRSAFHWRFAPPARPRCS